MNKISKIFIALCIVSLSAVAQKNDLPQSWHMMDKATSGYYGVSAD